MKYRELGKSGIEASVVGLGTWAIGGWMWGGADEREALEAIHASIDSGVNLIDTAPAYGFGLSEKIVGKALKDHRRNVLVATKCGLIWHKRKGDFFFSSDSKQMNEKGPFKVYRCLAPGEIKHEVEQSLIRLGTDYIDLYLTHWQDSTTPVPETMGTLMELKAEGKIRAIGCCNADTGQMEQYRLRGELDADQELYNMLDRKHEKENMPYAEKHNMAFLAYSPLAQGLLSGKTAPGRAFPEGDQRRDNERFSKNSLEKIREMMGRFRFIAQTHSLTTGQLVLAWTIGQPGCSHVLAGARNAAQASENSRAGDVNLTPDEIAHIRSVIEIFGADIP